MCQNISMLFPSRYNIMLMFTLNVLSAMNRSVSGFNMPRNHKDKYDNNSSRRSYTIMSPEEAASGKKTFWTELEITGTIRNLSPNLWHLENLTALYLKNNCLTRLPPEICHLVNLRSLDLSNNKLRSLPAELGDLIYLRYILYIFFI